MLFIPSDIGLIELCDAERIASCPPVDPVFLVHDGGVSGSVFAAFAQQDLLRDGGDVFAVGGEHMPDGEAA